jgi:rhodanese-related sulfurtransferase
VIWGHGCEWRSYRRITFAELPADATVVDVRRHDEHDERHLRSAVHIALHELLDRLDEVPDDELFVHCASGYRASIAASLLDRAGHDVVLVDDDIEHADRSGRTVE